MLRSTTDIKRAAPKAVLGALLSENQSESRAAAEKLIAQAAGYGLGLRDYLRLAVDARLADDADRAQFMVGNDVVNGYEAALSFLNLPVRDDLDGGIMLQAAADTFQTFTGVRALFPEVIDDMVQWKYRQTNFERIDGLISQSRTINGTELLTTVIEDTAADYEEAVGAVAESGRIPIHAIKASQKSVKFFKFGNGYKTTYEFNRRVALDYLTPYAIRTQAQIQRSKVAVATSVLLNGDGAHGAAPVVAQSSFNDEAGVNATAGVINWKHLTAWLAARAQAGAPVDTVLGNWNAYLQWLWMFELKGTGTKSDVEDLARAGVTIQPVGLLTGSLKFELSTSAPAGQLIGFSKGDTLEELKEAGSLINESESSIKTQEVTYVRTENSGFKLTFGDTRSAYDYSA